MNNRQFVIAVTLGVIVLALGAFGWSLYGPKDVRKEALDPKTHLMVPSALGDQSLGKDDAPVTIIEYASMTCPHCARFHEITFPELKKRYIDTGKVRFIFREFPLDSVAATAFMIARCAPKDRYFPLVDVLFNQQEKWAVGPPASPLPPLLAIAKTVGFTEESFNACLKDQKVLDGIKWTFERGSQLGVQSTPSFFINFKLYAGGMSIEDMAKIIDPLLPNS